jgi:hypothetical protein
MKQMQSRDCAGVDGHLQGIVDRIYLTLSVPSLVVGGQVVSPAYG